MKGLIASVLFGVCVVSVNAQTPPGRWLMFSLDRSGGAGATRYQIRIEQSTGQGFYHSELPDGPGQTAHSELPITVQEATLKKMFAAVPLVKSNRCDSHNKSIAQTGIKTLRYSVDGSVSECTYNYSLDDRVNTATEVFEAVAQTMQYGQQLAAKLRFDRLGLDAEIDNLQAALNEGQALELNNIVSVLQAVENDDRVMERVRRKAAHLIEAAGRPGTQASADSDLSSR